MDKGQKGHSEFIIAGSDPAKNFELIEKTLDQVALLVGVKIAEPGLNHIAFGRNGVRCPLLCNIGSDGLRSVCLITQDITPGNAHF